MLMPVKIFFCYAHEDEALLNQLKAHLRPLQRQGLIDLWHDRNISAGTEWEQKIKEHLDSAQIVLLLVSPDFMNSDYCYSIEMQRAIERHEQGETRVIPVILRPVYWQGAPFGKLQALPTDAIPVTSSKWHDLDEAFFHVAEGIRKAIVELPAKSKEQWLEEADVFLKLKRYQEALAAYEQAIRLDPNDHLLYMFKGSVLVLLHRGKEAQQAFEKCKQLERQAMNNIFRVD
jgi:tetratricopeptide (TPR) repeat protein